MRRPDKDSEERLDAIRRSAMAGNLEKAESYYGLPLLKAPVWTWEVPVYFFVGGAAGASAVIGFAARVTGADTRLVRDARWLAAIGATLSAPLLIADLGRPERFLNMLRVFKPQSPMSVGAWIVAAFGGASTAAVILPRTLGDVAAAASAILGLGMSTYTGVLLGATAVPVWANHVTILPIHFGASGVASAISILQLRGHDQKALNKLGIAAAAFETLVGFAIERRKDRESEPLRVAMIRAAGLLSGPVPLFLRLVGRSRRSRRAAAISTLIGSMCTRVAWVAAGRASTRDPRVALRGGHTVSAGEAVGKGSSRRKDGEGQADTRREK
jgi:formate-dependent nitrite reductase membrane component NrfD